MCDWRRRINQSINHSVHVNQSVSGSLRCYYCAPRELTIHITTSKPRVKVSKYSRKSGYKYLASASCRIWSIFSMALTRQSACHQMFWWHPEFIIPRTTTALSARSLGTGPKSGRCHCHCQLWWEFDNVTARSATTRNFNIPVAILNSLQ